MTPTPSHQALYRRWRSQRFAEVVGQDAVVATLRNAVRSGRFAHAYLFVGPRGTGKTSLARIVAKAVNCPNVSDGEPCDACPSCEAIREGRALDVVELDAASNNRVDDIRELLPRIYTAPADLPTKVFIVDEVQRITQGWDVLLKTLEEPPPHVLFIFCTTDSSQIRPAVISRVQRFDFRPLPIPLIEAKLARILAADARTAEPAAVDLVARLADGGMRDAESILDQLLSAGSEMLTADAVRDLLGLADAESVAGYGRALVIGDPAAGIAVLDALEDRGRDVRSFTDQVVAALRGALHAALAGTAADDPLAGYGAASLAAAARRLADIDPTRPGPGGLRLALELALFEAAAPAAGAGQPFAETRRGSDAGDGVPAVPLASTGTGARAAPGSDAGRPRGTDALEPTPDVLEPALEAEPPPTAPAALAAPPAVAPGPQRAGTPGTSHAADDSIGPESGPAGTSGVPSATTARAAADAPPGPAAAPAAPAGEDREVQPAPDAPPAAPAGEDHEVQPAPDAPPAAPADLDEIRRRWPEIVAMISRHPPTKPLIEACRPIAADGAVVTLGFAESQLFLRDVADRRRGTLEDGLGRVLGHPVTVRCVATNLDLEPPLAEDPESAAVLRAARDVWGDDLVEIREVH